MSWLKKLLSGSQAKEIPRHSPRVQLPDLSENDDPLYEQAAEYVIKLGSCSVSEVQRHFKVGYSRASALVQSLESDLVISPVNASGKRMVLSIEGRQEERNKRDSMLLAAQVEVQTRLNRLIAKYGDPGIAEMIMDGEVWEGMSKDQLIDSMGKPESIDSSLKSSITTETWKYGHMGHTRYSARVVVKNGVVTGWDIKG